MAGAVDVFVAVSLAVAVGSAEKVLLWHVGGISWLTIISSRVPPGKVCRQTYAFSRRGGCSNVASSGCHFSRCHTKTVALVMQVMN